MKKNRFLINKMHWVRYPILGLLICPATLSANGIALSAPDNQGTDIVQQDRRTRTIIGSVIDKTDNTPLIGANIKVLQSNVGVITDVDGNFSVNIPIGGAKLEVSYIGYKTQTISVSDQGVLHIALESDTEVLNEVVVVGAGSQKKISVTGAISTVESASLKMPTSSLTTSFAGKLAGVISRVSSGEPGRTSDFYIRGKSTFGGVNTPLIILDGVEISVGDLDRIPPETIESFSILKDASATAIYGARGANGVMVVTTKSGEENSASRINVTLENSIVHPTKIVKWVDGARWMELYNEANIARGGEAYYSDYDIEMTRKGTAPLRYPNVDWYDLMFKNMNMNQRANVNISGGGTRATYYMSVQANHDTGMMDIPSTYSFDNNINRWNYNLQANVGYKLTKTTKLDLRINAQLGTNKGPNEGTNEFFEAAYDTNPIAFPAIFPAQEGDEHIRFGNRILSGTKLYGNPYARMLSSYKQEEYSTLNASFSVDQKLDFITKGLKIKLLANLKSWASTGSTLSLDPYYYQMNESSWTQDDNGTEMYTLNQIHVGQEYISQGNIGASMDRTIYIDGRIDYDRTFADLHNVTGMLMYMQREVVSGGSALPRRYQGLSGRFTYDFDHRYLAEFNFGYNGTERLKDNRFEFFPAASIGWVISGEQFWKPLEKVVNFLKVRGSYGAVGSSDMIGPHFLFEQEVDMSSGGGFYWGDPFVDNYRRGPKIGTLPVENACWERVYKLDIGADVEFFNQLKVAVDYFKEDRKKILMSRASWPKLLGYDGAIPYSNIGRVINEGFDLSVNWKKEIIKDFWADMRFNLTYNKNWYKYKDEPDYPYVWKTETGKPLDRQIGYICDGFFESEEEIANAPQHPYGNSALKVGDLKYRDVNGDGSITSDDQVMISPYGADPRLQWGLGLNLVYKKWDLGLFFNGSGMRSFSIAGMKPFAAQESNGPRNVLQIIADSYYSVNDPTNFNVNYPRLAVLDADAQNNMVNSTFWLRDGKFVRFKTLELGYRFKFCRVYFTADNLAVWSPFKGWDPELGWNSYPLSQTFNIGAQFSF